MAVASRKVQKEDGDNHRDSRQNRRNRTTIREEVAERDVPIHCLKAINKTSGRIEKNPAGEKRHNAITFGHKGRESISRRTNP